MGRKPPEKPIDPEDLIDEALEETFPASDPISPGVGAGEPIRQSGGKPPQKRKPRRQG